jgi:hypothetical protein
MDRGNPLRAIFRPEENPVTRSDASLGQQCGKAPRQPGYLSIAGCTPPDALMANYRNLSVVASKVVE